MEMTGHARHVRLSEVFGHSAPVFRVALRSPAVAPFKRASAALPPASIRLRDPRSVPDFQKSGWALVCVWKNA